MPSGQNPYPCRVAVGWLRRYNPGPGFFFKRKEKKKEKKGRKKKERKKKMLSVLSASPDWKASRNLMAVESLRDTQTPLCKALEPVAAAPTYLFASASFTKYSTEYLGRYKPSCRGRGARAAVTCMMLIPCAHGSSCARLSLSPRDEMKGREAKERK